MVPASFFLWPFIGANDALAAQASGMARFLDAICAAPRRDTPRPGWASANVTRLDLATMELRDFSTQDDGVATLVCAPFALHSATLADFAPGHSLVQTLAQHGGRRLFVTDWRSATEDMRLLTIDNYLADLNVAVDEIGGPVDLVGLCQGGIMAVIYAARFPDKVRRLVLAASPVDIDAAPSLLSLTARTLPLALFDESAHLGRGRIVGRHTMDVWGPAVRALDADVTLQLEPCDDIQRQALRQRFRDWFDWTLDLPGAYYHQTVEWLFKENRLAQGRLRALGRIINLADLHHPLFLLAAQNDEIVPPGQLYGIRRLVGTKPDLIETALLPGGHLSLFLGARNLADGWSKVACWLDQSCKT